MTVAITRTTGTKIPETLSATFAMGALEEEAILTLSIILFITVSFPTFRALHLRDPLTFIVDENTLSPRPLSTGRLSPVRVDSSKAPFPSSMIPSTGTLEPGRRMKVSPVLISAVLTSTSFPSLMTMAVSGERDINAFNRDVVLPLLLASSIFPRVIRARIMAADSK